MTIAITQENPPDHQEVEVTPPGATTPVRWSEDEGTLSNILDDLEYDDEMPGGYKSASNLLNRDPQSRYYDIVPYGEAKIRGAGRKILWEGSLDKGSKSSGDQSSVDPTFLGYQAILNDNNCVNVGIIDGDLSKFGSLSPEHQVFIIAAGHPNDADIVTGVNAGSTASGVFITVDLEAEGFHRGEVMYYGDGVKLGSFLFDFVGGGFDEAWTDQAVLAGDSNAGSPDSSPDYNQVTALQQRINASGNRYYLFLVVDRNGGFGVPTLITHSFQNCKVLGTHQMPYKGTWPNIGFSPQQILLYLINNFCAPLEATEDSIEDDGYVVPQAWYPNAEVSSIVKDTTKYALNDWFVYNGKLMEYRKPGTYNNFWKAYTVPSALNELGVDSQRLWRSIVVTYQDFDGSTKSVGPIGSGATIETSACEINDPQHPAVLAGRTRNDQLALKGIGSPQVAITVAERFLEEANLLNRSGSATLKGFVLDSNSVLHPVSHVKSGDWIKFVDASDTSYRKIIHKGYTHSSRTAEIDLDAPASGLEALLERLQAKIVELGVA